jgi:hypothetical protein
MPSGLSEETKQAVDYQHAAGSFGESRHQIRREGRNKAILNFDRVIDALLIFLKPSYIIACAYICLLKANDQRK